MDLLVLLTIPITSALVGWGTNWTAIQMMLFPLEFVGIPPYLGWQGIVPRRAEKIATLAVGVMTERLLDVKELFERLDSDRVAELLEEPLDRLVGTLADDLVRASVPRLWEVIPHAVQVELLAQVRAETPRVVVEVMDELKERIDEVLDIKDLVVRAMVRDKALMVRLFQEIGSGEFRFVVRSGLYFGLPLGVIQMLVWWMHPAWWVLPVAGVFVGTVTNFLAIKLIFHPRRPTPVGSLVLHGVFMKRQREVSETFARLATTEVLHPENLVDALLRGPASDRLHDLISRRIRTEVDRQVGIGKTLAVAVIGPERWVEIKDRAVDRVLADIPRLTRPLHAYTDEALDLERTLATKMTAMSPEEFEDLLRPAFRQDEWQLVAMGAVLGLIVGWVQFLALAGP